MDVETKSSLFQQAFHAPLALLPATFLSLLLTFLWTSFFTLLPIRPTLTRKLVHITTAPLYFLLCLPLYPPTHPLTPLFSTLPPLLGSVVSYLKPPILFPDVGGRTSGTVAYGISVAICILVRWWGSSVMLGNVGVVMMAGGDGMAGMIGKWFKGSESEGKTWVGTLGFVGGGLIGWKVFRISERVFEGGESLEGLGSFGGWGDGVELWKLLAVVGICASVEGGVGGEDNFTVPLTAVAVGWILGV